MFIEGKVQGVFYRVWSKNVAKDLNIKGWIKNLDDGRVEAMLEGRREDVEELIERMKHGPDMAKVDKINTKILESSEDFEGFAIMT